MPLLFVYHVRLAARSLRRDPGLSAAIVVGLMVATSMWTVTAANYVRLLAPTSTSLTIQRVELPHAGAVSLNARASPELPSSSSPRIRLTFAEAELLAASNIPARRMATFRSRLLVAAGGGAPEVMLVRFIDRDFFALFGQPLCRGEAWTSDDEREHRPVAVLGRKAAARLFPEPDVDPVGRAVMIDGHPHRVVGVLARDQPNWVEWDLSALGQDQDAVYLPFAAHRPLLARPEGTIYQIPPSGGLQTPPGGGYDDFLRSDAVFVSFWAELPTAAAEAAFRGFLDQRLGRPYRLRSIAQWRRDRQPFGGAEFFATLTLLLLLGAGFNMARLLLARGLARSEELAVFRALGATRAALLGRHLVEAALLVLPSALLGQLLALPYLAFWNAHVQDTDIPLRLTGPVLLMGVVPSAIVGMLAALYPAWRLSGLRPAVAVARR